MGNKPLTVLPTGYKSNCSVTASNHTHKDKICIENMGETLGDRIGLSDEVINVLASLAMKAHDCTGEPFLRKKGLPVTVGTPPLDDTWHAFLSGSASSGFPQEYT